MDKKDWFDCGARIGDLVQSAIDSNNYQHLNEAISDAIRDTAETIQKSFAGNGNPESMSGRSGYGEYRAKGTAYGQAKEKVNTGDLFDTLTRSAGEKDGKGSKKVRKTFRGIASMVTGFSLTALFGLGALVCALVSKFFMGGSGLLFSTILLTILAAVSGILGYRGYGERKKLKRASQYMTIVGDREYCTVEELAAGTGQSVKAVQKDLREMIADGYFDTAAYLDEGETTFMVSQAAYRQYMDALKASRQQRMASEQQAQARRDAEKNMASLSEETRTILQEGKDFIAHIHECNEQIPDEAMSEKLDVLEGVVTRIFQQVEAKPENAPDLHRMMSYYLPITEKLINAYIELDDQNLKGENVRKTRQEIEMSLDTINGAFETFLDSFFQDTAWDISSDITTLKTMMARDGLTGNKDFAGGERIRTVGRDLTAGSASAGEVPAAGGSVSSGTGSGAGAAGAAQMQK